MGRSALLLASVGCRSAPVTAQCWPFRNVCWIGALVLTLALVVPSAAAAPMAQAQISFVRGPSIFLASATGTNQRVLLRGQSQDNGKSYFHPAYSPSGRLAFTLVSYPTGTHGYYDVRVLRPGRSSLLVAESSFVGSATWAPDSKRLGLIYYNYSNGGCLYVAPLRGDGNFLGRCNANTVEDQPAWSPDGKLIAFVELQASGLNLFLIRPNGTSRTQLTTTPAHNPSWSPDGEQIVFDDGRDIDVVNADGSGFRALSGEGARETNPAWSPDGSQIAFVRSGSVWVMDASGGNVRRLIRNARQPAWKPR
jgi:Tol biopolymer transport system component